LTDSFIGKKYGRLTILDYFCLEKKGRFRCRCDCGKIVTVRRSNLVRGLTLSCGCLHRDKTIAASLKHGHTANRKRSPEYRAWMSMKRRCLYPGHDSYTYYSKIPIAHEYLESFERFLEDVGPRPSSNYSIDRIDNLKGYVPGNLRWATREMQIQNRTGIRRAYG
jgi:hypothetical protein